MLTVLRVSSDDRGSFLKVELSVLPSTKAGTALSSLRKNSKSIAKKLQTKTRLKRIPKLDWNLDLYNNSDYELDMIFKQIEDEKMNNLNILYKQAWQKFNKLKYFNCWSC